MQCGSLAQSKEGDAWSSHPEGRAPRTLCAKALLPGTCCACADEDTAVLVICELEALGCLQTFFTVVAVVVFV